MKKKLNLNENKQYYRIENYSMKCRLYPNKECAEKIDLAIRGIQTFYNCTLYEMFNNGNLVTEKPKKSDGEEVEEEVVHFPDFKAVGGVAWKKKMIEEHPIVTCAPSSAITCKSGIVVDMQKSLSRLPGQETGSGRRVTYPIECQRPSFYSKRRPRRSYSYQESYNKVSPTENKNVLKINLCKIGMVKVRGWNQEIRFDADGETDFVGFCKAQAKLKKAVTVTVSKDNCNDYWIVFKLPFCYKLMSPRSEKAVGLDVGIKDIIITSDGTKYENKKIKQNHARHEKMLHRRLARRQGYANEKFRARRKKDRELLPSKSYERTQLKLARLSRKIVWKRENYNHCITTEIINDSKFVGVESLDVKGMYQNRSLSKALSDAAIGEVLNMIKYKGSWYGRIVQPIGRWVPSSKTCNSCGYVLPKLSLSTREWICPCCGERHDRDINAAKNIRDIAYHDYMESA